MLLAVVFLWRMDAVEAAPFQATGPSSESYGGSGDTNVIEVTFSNTTARTLFRFPFYALMTPGQIANGDDCMYFNGWAEGYDTPNQNPNWNVAGHQYEPSAENDPGFANCAFQFGF